MTTTKALAKLYKVITGAEAKNSIGRILSDLADAWSGTSAAKIPPLPATGSTATYVLKATKDGDNYTYSWVAES